jgi:hypothetical protein
MAQLKTYQKKDKIGQILRRKPKKTIEKLLQDAPSTHLLKKPPISVEGD